LGWFFRDFFLTKFYRKVFSFDSGRGSIAGPAWKSTTDSITPWKRGRSGRLGSTRSQKHHRPPQVTRKRTRGRFLPLSVLRTRVARSFTISHFRKWHTPFHITFRFGGSGGVGTYQRLGDGRNLGVIVDSQLTLSAQVAAVCRSGYYQLQQLRPLVRLMSSDAVKTLVRAFNSCRLDYCNSMFYGITDGLMSRLQSVQNAAARCCRGLDAMTT